MESRVLQSLMDEAEDLGFKPGTPSYEKALCRLKVTRCKQMQGVSECPACVAHDSCTLVQEFYMDIRYPERRGKDPKQEREAL